MKKMILLLLCLYLASHYQIFGFNRDSNPKQNNLSSLYQQVLSLEDQYNNKLLRAHGIDPNDLNKQLTQIENPKEKEEFKKNYIMSHGHLTEKQYQDIFMHPLTQLQQSSSKTVDDLENTYQSVKDKISKLENLINDLTSLNQADSVWFFH